MSKWCRLLNCTPGEKQMVSKVDVLWHTSVHREVAHTHTHTRRSVGLSYEWAETSEVSTFLKAVLELCQGDGDTTQLWALWTVLNSLLVASCCLLGGSFPSSLCTCASSVLGHADSLRGLMPYWLKGEPEFGGCTVDVFTLPPSHRCETSTHWPLSCSYRPPNRPNPLH